MANDWCQLSVSDGLLEKAGKTLHTDATANSLRVAVELFNGEIDRDCPILTPSFT